MRRMILWALGVGVAAVVLVVAGLRVPAVQDFVLRRVIARRMSGPPSELFNDSALRVLLCGTSSPLPHPTRAKPCVAVFAGGKFWVVDTGLGSWNRLALWQVDGRNIGAVLLTHFHSDHIGELGEFNLQTWGGGTFRAAAGVWPAGGRARG